MILRFKCTGLRNMNSVMHHLENNLKCRCNEEESSLMSSHRNARTKRIRSADCPEGGTEDMV